MYSLNDEFSIETINNFTKLGMIVDGSKGGLILGRSHEEGGILVIVKRLDKYIPIAEFEGYEYLFNPAASQRFSKYFDVLNQDVTEFVGAHFETYNPPGDIRIIDANLFIESKFIILDSPEFSIFNKKASKGFLRTLNTINESVSIHRSDLGISEIAIRYNDPIDINFYDQYIGQIIFT